MAFDDPVNHGKPHAGALTFLLGSEKRIKTPLHHFRRHTMTGIAHREPHKLSGCQTGMMFGEISIEVHLREVHLQRSAVFLHGITRVGAQIHDDLMNAGWIRYYRHVGVDAVVNLDG